MDDFLKTVMTANGGWVPVKILRSFWRINRLLRMARKEIPIVNQTLLLSSAIRESSSLLKLSEDGLKVQRATPME